MSTIGITSEPTYGQRWTGANTDTQVAYKVTMPTDGTITAVGVWMAGYVSSVTAYCCVWNSSGTLVAQSASFTATGRSFGLGQSDLYYKTLTSPYAASSGQVLYIGFSRNPAGSAQWGYNSTGTHYDHSNTGSYPANASFALSGYGSIGAYATYSANSPPNPPTWVSPANGAILTDTTPDLIFDHSDPEGDPIFYGYDIQVSTDNTFVSVTHWDIDHQSSGISGNRVTRTYAGTALSRGVTYYMRSRTSDELNGYGAYSSTRNFKINSLPVATKVSPASAGFAYIHNLGTDTSEWASAGSHAKPRFGFNYSDADGDAIAGVKVYIYAASAGGSPLNGGGAGETFTGSNIKSGSGYNYYVDSAYAGVRGTEYWWSIDVQDARGEWQGESSRTAFKMQWGQALYDYAVTGGTSASSLQFTPASVATNTQAGYLFRSATGSGGSGAGSWYSDIGQVTPNAYLNVLVRLATNNSGTNPNLTDMTFDYVASGVIPSKWTFSPGGDWVVDESRRRFGSRALKMTVVSSADAPTAISDPFPVQVNNEYTMSFYARMDSAASGSNALYALVLADDLATPISSQIDWTNTTGTEGWQRFTTTFTVPSGVTQAAVKFGYTQTSTVAGDQCWFDAAMVEEGDIASSWKPGSIGPAAIADVGGFVIDGSNGGIFRARGATGAARDTVELGDHGWVFGGDLEVWSDEASALWAEAGKFVGTSGFVPAAYAIGVGWDSPNSASRTLAASAGGNSGSIIAPILVSGPMQLDGAVVYNTDTASARSAEWRLYRDRDNDSTLYEVSGANGTWSFTPTVASARASTASGAPVLIAPGIYWLVIRNTSGSQTFGVALGTAGPLANFSSREDTSTAALGSTFDTSGTSSFSNRGFLVMLKGRVFGESSGY